jgi:hypothetical protein
MKKKTLKYLLTLTDQFNLTIFCLQIYECIIATLINQRTEYHHMEQLDCYHQVGSKHLK